MYRVAAFFVVVLGNPRAVESASETPLCRCEASFERLYDRRHRHLLEGFDRGLKNSASDSFPYDYGTAYINDEGYFVIDGVVVLPDDNELCQAFDHDNRVKAWMTLFGEHRNLKEDSNKQQQHSSSDTKSSGTVVGEPTDPEVVSAILDNGISTEEHKKPSDCAAMTGELMTEEKRAVGHVKLKVYFAWAKAAGGAWVPFLIAGLFAFVEGMFFRDVLDRSIFSCCSSASFSAL